MAPTVSEDQPPPEAGIAASKWYSSTSDAKASNSSLASGGKRGSLSKIPLPVSVKPILSPATDSKDRSSSSSVSNSKLLFEERRKAFSQSRQLSEPRINFNRSKINSSLMSTSMTSSMGPTSLSSSLNNNNNKSVTRIPPPVAPKPRALAFPPAVAPKPSGIRPPSGRQLLQRSTSSNSLNNAKQNTNNIPRHSARNPAIKRESSFDSTVSMPAFKATGSAAALAASSSCQQQQLQSLVMTTSMTAAASNGMKSASKIPLPNRIFGSNIELSGLGDSSVVSLPVTSRSKLPLKKTASTNNASWNQQQQRQNPFQKTKLKSSKSVDLFRAQLEEKDKTIEALKLAAEERDWKLEKLQLNMQNFKSVGSLRDLSTTYAPYSMENIHLASLDPVDPAKERVCDYQTFMKLLQENAQLSRTVKLLQKEDSGEDNSTLASELKMQEARIKELEALLQGRNVDLTLVEEKTQLQSLNLGLAEKIGELREKESLILKELQNSKDQVELLEFQVLEMEEDEEKKTPSSDEGIMEDPLKNNNIDRSISKDSGFFLSSPETEELNYTDFKTEKLADTKARLQTLMSNTPDPKAKSVLLQTSAVFESLVTKIEKLQDENGEFKRANVERDTLVLELEASRSKLEEVENELGAFKEKNTEISTEIVELGKKLAKKDQLEKELNRQLDDARNHLSSGLIGRQSESEMYEEAVVKASYMEKSLNELKAKLKSLNEENMELKEQLSNALEVGTSKSVGSLGSELSGHMSPNHRKAPSVISDASDRRSSKTTSSGVSSDLSDSSDNEHSEGSERRRKSDSMSPTSGEEEDKEKTNTILRHGKSSVLPPRETMGSRMGESGIFMSPSPDLRPTGKNDHVDVGVQAHPVQLETVFEISNNSNKSLEIGDLREECRNLVTRKNSLEGEIEVYKDQIKALKNKENNSVISEDKLIELERTEYSLRNQLKEWERKYSTLHTQNQGLLEEKCELEEAENDSRLNAQRWEGQYRVAYEKNEQMNAELQNERKTTMILRDELTESRSKEAEAKSDCAYLEALIQRYEQRIFDLEEVEVELKEKLTLLEQTCKIVTWIRTLMGEEQFSSNNNSKSKALPMFIEFEERSAQTDVQTQPREEVQQIKSLEVQNQPIEAQTQSLEVQTLSEEESNSKSVIRQLESEKSELETKIRNLESKISKGENSAREILDLKLEIDRLEFKLKEVEIQLRDERELRSKLQFDLEEKENALNRLVGVEADYNDLLVEIRRLKEIEKKFSESQAEQGFLSSRLEELEENETGLLSSLEVVDKKNRAAADKIKELEETAKAAEDKAGVESMQKEAFRVQIEGLSTRIKQLGEEADAKAVEAAEVESEHRSEVSRCRVNSSAVTGGENIGTSGVKRATSVVSGATSSVYSKKTVTTNLNQNEGGGKTPQEDGDNVNDDDDNDSRCSTPNSFNLQRYRSIRDHTGRYFLVVKIR